MHDTRTITNTRTAEQHVLGTIIERAIRGEDLYPQVARLLDTSDFYDAFHRRVFAVMSEASSEGLPPSETVLWSKLKIDTETEDPRDFWNLCEAGAIPEALPFHCAEVKEASVRRKMTATANRLSNLATDTEQAPQAVLSAASDKLNELSRALQPKRQTKPSAITDEVFALIAKRRENPGTIPGISTGFYGVDNLMLGFERGVFYVIGGRPSMGKSCFAFNAAHNIAVGQNLPVAIFSIETSRRGVMERLLVRQSGVYADLIKRGLIQAPELSALESAKAKLDAAPLYIFDAQDKIATVAEIKAHIQSMDTRPAVVFIDHFHKMKGTIDSTTDDRRIELEGVSSDLVAMARELDVAVVLLAQLSRGVEARRDKRPVLSDLKECGGLEQDADVAMFLFREEYYEPKDENQGQAEVIIRKNRDGATGDIKLAFHGALQSFYTIDHNGLAIKSKEYYLGEMRPVQVREEPMKDYHVIVEDGRNVYVRGDLRMRVWTEQQCYEKLCEWAQRPDSEQIIAWRKTAEWLMDQPDELHSKWAQDCLTQLTYVQAHRFPMRELAPSIEKPAPLDLFSGLETGKANNETTQTINLFAGLD